jgi:hypothetical protein
VERDPRQPGHGRRLARERVAAHISLPSSNRVVQYSSGAAPLRG